MNFKCSGILLAVVLSIVATACRQDNEVVRGAHDFDRLGCYACHTKGPGPNLAQVVRTQDSKFLEQFIANPSKIYEQRGMRPLNEGYTLMPDMHATPQDAREIVVYLQSLKN
jgi:Cytochrome c